MRKKQSPAPPAKKMDQVDVEALTRLRSSREWMIYEARITRMLSLYRKSLETDLSHEKTVAVRGAVLALRTVLELPDILLNEAKTSEGLRRVEQENE